MFFNYKGGWNCPCCKSPIIIGKDEAYQTLDEHVCNPNRRSPERPTLVCSNPNCITVKNEVFWDDYGDMYGGFKIKDTEFINSNNSPFGSLGRKLNVEIYKAGVKDKKYLSPAWLLWFYQPMLVHDYQADEQGNVLKHSFHFEFLRKDDRISKGSYCIVTTPFWRTWKFLWKRFKRNLKQYKSTGHQSWLESAFDKSANRGWIYKLFENFVQFTYPKYFKEYKKLKYNINHV